ncbi:MAG: DUF952 domain-containing protein, partial [Microbacteriaceae bacterium]
MAPLYKILPAARWATATDTVPWADVDTRDGFFHMSTREQLEETARRHFVGQSNLVLLAIDPSSLHPDTLRWEPSRGGALFPHVYGDVPRSAVIRVTPIASVDA